MGGANQVSVSISVYSVPGQSTNRDWRMGRANAPVLSEPVSAKPIMSLPVNKHTKYIDTIHNIIISHLLKLLVILLVVLWWVSYISWQHKSHISHY